MTNWCEGTLRVRGKKENLKRFLLQGLRTGDFYGKKPDRPVVDEEHAVVFADGKVMIEDVSRGFIDELKAPIHYIDECNSIVCFHARFAWKVRSEELLEICNKYHVDMRIYSFEGDFNQDIEIVNGQITKDEWIEFDDYEWDCIHPYWGG